MRFLDGLAKNSAEEKERLLGVSIVGVNSACYSEKTIARAENSCYYVRKSCGEWQCLSTKETIGPGSTGIRKA